MSLGVVFRNVRADLVNLMNIIHFMNNKKSAHTMKNFRVELNTLKFS